MVDAQKLVNDTKPYSKNKNIIYVLITENMLLQILRNRTFS